MRTLLPALGASFAVSLIAKILADILLVDRIAIVGTFVGLQRVENPGVAFGLILPAGLQPILILVAMAVVCMVALRSTHTRLSEIAFGVLLGGALGNAADRLVDAHVTDFIQIGWFPVFNVADACITVGVVLLALEYAWTVRMRRRAHASGPPPC